MLTKSPPIILASTSPRRKELLESLDISFQCVPPLFEEKIKPDETPSEYVIRNATGKALSVIQNLSLETEFIIISADTIVVLDNAVLEKPTSPAHAQTMLQALSGRTHTVLTGLSIARGSRVTAAANLRASVIKSEVKFRSIFDAEISQYIATGDSLDKAGAYSIQGKAAKFIREIRGSYTNVMGLPLAETWEALNTLLHSS